MSQTLPQDADEGVMDVPDEIEVRFLGYRLDVISRWPSSPRKLATAEAVSRRLTSIARSALVRPEIEELLHTSCRLLDDFFTADYVPSTDLAAGALPGVPPPASCR